MFGFAQWLRSKTDLSRGFSGSHSGQEFENRPLGSTNFKFLSFFSVLPDLELPPIDFPCERWIRGWSGSAKLGRYAERPAKISSEREQPLSDMELLAAARAAGNGKTARLLSPDSRAGA